MKLQGADVDAARGKLDPKLRAALVYGPDRGLVSERAGRIAAQIVPDLGDPFRVVEIGSASLADSPGILADAVAEIGFGGRRLVRLKAAGNEAEAACALALAAPGDGFLLVEAGDLDARSALRTLFEKAAEAGAIPCYPDDGRALGALLAQALSEHRVTIAPQARDWLLAHLGGDRMMTRGELEKLCLLAGPGGRLDLDTVIAAIGDSAALVLDDIVHAALEGDLPGFAAGLARAEAAGLGAHALLRTAQRQVQRLHRFAAAPDPLQAVEAARLFFKDKPRVLAQLRNWPLPALSAALRALTEADIQSKTTGLPDQAIAAQALLALAQRSSRAKSGHARSRP